MCGGGGGGGGDGGAAEREAERQARIAAGTEAVNSIFGIGNDTAKAQREQLYTTTGDDTRNYYTTQLEQDKADARRQLEFAKARAGLVGSSQGTDMDTQFQDRYDRGLLEIANRADTASSGMRTSDEQSRLGLISKVAAGVDQGSASASALAQLQSNLDSSRNTAMSGRMANVFSDLISGYKNGQVVAGQTQAAQQYGNQLGNFINASDSNGIVSK